jgi:LysR family transcriptional activator of mexEF-oprN operon
MRAVVLRADKPTKPLTLEEYCSRPHVVVSHTAATKGIADEYLDAIGRTRKVVLSVPQFNSLPAIIAGTNLLAACPDYAAKTLEDWGSLYAEPLPFDLPPLELNMVWLAMTDTDPAELWIRCRLQEHMSEGC